MIILASQFTDKYTISEQLLNKELPKLHIAAVF